MKRDQTFDEVGEKIDKEAVLLRLLINGLPEEHQVCAATYLAVEIASAGGGSFQEALGILEAAKLDIARMREESVEEIEEKEDEEEEND